MYEATFQVDKKLYPVRALLKAAYRFIDQCYIHLSEREDAWMISVTRKEPDKALSTIMSEFENELILQSVRLSIYQQTYAVREMLFARAVSSSMMVGNRRECSDYHESDISDSDLKQILIDWFEKYE